MNVAAIAPSQNPQLVPLQNESKSLWLFSLPVDVGLLLVPLLVATPLGLYALLSNDNSGYQTFNYWAWIAQFIFGNTTHVILTFFLLGAKTDVLTATKGQAPLVIVGSSITFLAAVGFFYLCKVIIPEFSDLAVAVGLTFSLHHSLSQTKGLWSLYNLRALEQKVPIAPNELDVRPIPDLETIYQPLKKWLLWRTVASRRNATTYSVGLVSMTRTQPGSRNRLRHSALINRSASGIGRRMSTLTSRNSFFRTAPVGES